MTGTTLREPLSWHLFGSFRCIFRCIAARTKLRIILNRILQLHVLTEKKQIKELSKIQTSILFVSQGHVENSKQSWKLKFKKWFIELLGVKVFLDYKHEFSNFLMFPKNKWEISGSKRFWRERNTSLTTSMQNQLACNVISATNLPDFFSHSEVLVHLDFQKRKCLSLCRNIETSLLLATPAPPHIFGDGNPRNVLI